MITHLTVRFKEIAWIWAWAWARNSSKLSKLKMHSHLSTLTNHSQSITNSRDKSRNTCESQRKATSSTWDWSIINKSNLWCKITAVSSSSTPQWLKVSHPRNSCTKATSTNAELFSSSALWAIRRLIRIQIRCDAKCVLSVPHWVQAVPVIS